MTSSRLLPPEPVDDVLQYQRFGKNADEVMEFVYGIRVRGASPGDHLTIQWGSSGSGYQSVRPGQFLVKHSGGRVTVHDTDPSVEAEWEYRGKLRNGQWTGPVSDIREFDAVFLFSHFGDQDHPMPIQRRPVYRFAEGTFTGNWEEVE